MGGPSHFGLTREYTFPLDATPALAVEVWRTRFPPHVLAQLGAHASWNAALPHRSLSRRTCVAARRPTRCCPW